MTVVSVASGWNLSSIALEWVSAVIGAVKCPSSVLKFPEFLSLSLSPFPLYMYIHVYISLSPLLPHPTKFHTYNDRENSTRTFVTVVKILDVTSTGDEVERREGKKRAEIRSQRALGIYEFMATIVIYLVVKPNDSLSLPLSLFFSLSPFLLSRDRIKTISSPPSPVFLLLFAQFLSKIMYLRATYSPSVLQTKVCLTFIARDKRVELREKVNAIWDKLGICSIRNERDIINLEIDR